MICFLYSVKTLSPAYKTLHQYAAFVSWHIKGGLLHDEIPPFADQKAAFCKTVYFTTYLRPTRMYIPGADGRATRTPCMVYQALSAGDDAAAWGTPEMPEVTVPER